MQRSFLRLGSGKSARYGISPQAIWLDQAAAAGLPTPAGIILLDEAWEQLQAEGIVVVQGENVHVAGANTLLERLALHRLRRPVALRPAFSRNGRPATDDFPSYLNLAPDAPHPLIHALVTLWQAGQAQTVKLRRDILVLEMVAARQSGTALTQAAFEDDRVQLAGSADGAPRWLPQLAVGERSNEDDGGWRRLQQLLRGVRRTFHHLGPAWELEWADDGVTCWLLQLRRLDDPPARSEFFAAPQLLGSLPDSPSMYTTSVTAAAAPALTAWLGSFDPQWPAGRALIASQHGRLHLNLSLIRDMARRWGLPTTLMATLAPEADAFPSSDASHWGEVGWRWRRCWRHLGVLARLGWAQWRAAGRARQTIHTLRQSTLDVATTFSAVTNRHLELFIKVTIASWELMLARHAPLQRLRRAGVLTDYCRRQRPLTGDVTAGLEALHRLALDRPNLASDLAAGRVPADPVFQAAWQAFLAQHGQRAAFESDLACPRDQEAPARLLRCLAAALPTSIEPPEPPAHGQSDAITRCAGRRAHRLLQLEEALHSAARQAYAHLRTHLLTLATAAVAQGQLPSPEAIWQLTQTELGQLDAGWQPEAAFWQARARLVGDEERTRPAASPPSTLRGVGLGNDYAELAPLDATHPQTVGRAWVCRTPEEPLPSDFQPQTAIVVAPAVDAGWMPVVWRTAGVVVEMGGDLTYGALLLRELGRPAVIQVPNATRLIHHGDWLQVDARTGRVLRLALANPDHSD